VAARRVTSLGTVAIAASDPRVAEAAATLLPKANAIDLVIAGVVAAAAYSPSVLLGPVQILLGGIGSGLRAIDGRARQPGLGAQRPRGFLPSDEVPEAARVAVPALPAALAVTHALGGDLSFGRVVGPAVAIAKKESEERRAVLERLGRRGASVLTDTEVVEELVAAAGRMRGGLITAEDLAEIRPVAEDCRVERRGTRSLARAPWSSSEGPAQQGQGAIHVVAAADGRGRVAIACYERVEEGLEIPALGLLAPRSAAPVLRGETRVRPGEPRLVGSPMGLLISDGVLGAAVGFAGTHGEDSLTDMAEAFFGGLPIEASAPKEKGATCVGVVRTPTGARPFNEG